MTAKTTRSRKSIQTPHTSGRGRSSVANNRSINRTIVQGSQIKAFQKTVLDFYAERGRHRLPWRHTTNPYRILVSEVMLQQTQVDRVIPYYNAFLKKFPTVQALAKAPLGDVLRLWQGLGYNRRAKMLHEAARKFTTIYRSEFPYLYEDLVMLPGVGEYTAKAVRVFAFNEPEIMIETNIRAVFLHHFFPHTKRKVSDKEVVSYMIHIGIPKSVEPRVWYAALMDYGTHLKKTIPNPSQKSAHHTTQKPFKGSNREIRGAILRAVAKGSLVQKSLYQLPFDKKRINEQLYILLTEGLLKKSRIFFCYLNDR